MAQGAPHTSRTVHQVKHANPLAALRNVGPATLADFAALGITKIGQLAQSDADALYVQLCALTACRHDPCVHDVFAAAIHQARTGEPADWWSFTPTRKLRQQAGRFPAIPTTDDGQPKHKVITKMTDSTLTGLELRSTVTGSGELHLSLDEVTAPEPGPDEVTVRVEASPINPSDLGLLIGPADLSTMQAHAGARPGLKFTVPEAKMPAMSARLGESMPVGNEAAGTVIRAGANTRAMLGKVVGMLGGGMYTQVRTLPANSCIVLPDGATAADGASMFVNPLTALAMVETMQREGHHALVHTAAASNLGQMLNKICLADGVALVNIVRSAEQAAILRGIGAAHVVDSTTPDFAAALTDAVAQTGATIAFDAVGAGTLPNTILHAMEAAANRRATAYSRYGSSTFKQVYIYGWLGGDEPTIIDRNYGFAWAVGGFLLTPFLAKIGREAVQKLRDRVRNELLTTFASHYTRTLSLYDVLRPETVAAYVKKATGEKYLINPSLQE